MADDRTRAVIGRLRAVDWSDDSAAYEHANSRALLMREYLRRAAEWARAYGAEESWPFFDIAEHVAPEVRTPPDVAAELEEVLTGLSPASLRKTCRGAVRWAVPGSAGDRSPQGLPDDPYEPLLLMYERGGGYFVEEFLDLNGAMLRLGTVESNLSARPFLTLSPTIPDALDAEDREDWIAGIEAVVRSRARGVKTGRRSSGVPSHREGSRRPCSGQVLLFRASLPVPVIR